MIKTPLSTVIGGAFWTPKATIVGSTSKTLNQIIKSLFANNEQGFAYDPNDLTTMFQDAAGTIPVTAAGQPVGLMKDKSGRSNHAYQTTSASRPTLQRNATTGAYYLVFDGADDFLLTNNIDFTAADKVSLFAGVRKLSDATAGILVELSGNANTNNGSFFITAPQASGQMSYGFKTRGLVNANATGYEVSGYAAPISNVLSCKFNLASTTKLDGVVPRVNGVLSQKTPDTSSINNGGTYGNYPLYIGRRGGTASPFNGHIYSLIGIGRLTTDSETAALEKAIAKNTGVTLNV